MNKPLSYYTIALAAVLTAAFFASYVNKDQPRQILLDDTAIPQVVKPVNLDRPFDFAGERLPMDNFDVRERLDRELLVNTYWQSNTVLNIKNAYKFFPMIERKLKEHGVPEDFKYLAVAESGLRNAVSPAGARGLWQFLHSTAEEYGLEINREVDERYHYEKATDAACKMFKRYHRKFGTWTLVAAAYNAGYGRISNELEVQRAESYYDLNLNAETSRYVFRLVAIKEILSRPEEFGFYVEEDQRYPPVTDYKTVTVTESIDNLGDFAIEQGTSYRMLKVFNPWLLDSSLTISTGNSYDIKIPN
jgi:hypothetical protein